MKTFRKSAPNAPKGMYEAEAIGLQWLAMARAVRTPRVIEVDDSQIVLELVEGRRGPRFDDALGRGLAALHRAGAASFGFASNNFISILPQENMPREHWADFYREQRLLPLAAKVGRTKAIEALKIEMPEEPPSRLHGDLWAGNVLADENGLPVLIDPSVYGGHREMDLAMMRLFGGFSQRTFDAYAEAFPLEAGVEHRVELCQLYPLLVHAVLFGQSYLAQVDRVCATYS